MTKNKNSFLKKWNNKKLSSNQDPPEYESNKLEIAENKSP